MVDVVLRQRHAASDTTAATAALRSVLGVGAVSVGDGPFIWDQWSLVDDGVSVSRISSSGTEVRVRLERMPDLGAFVVRQGHVILTHDRTTVALDRGGIGLIPLGGTVELAWSDTAFDVYAFPLSAVARLLNPGADAVRLVLPRLTPRSDALGAFWHRLAGLLAAQVLDDADLYARDLLRSQVIDALIATTVEAFDLSDESADDADRDAAVVRRSIAHMREHLGEPLSIPEVAAAAGVSVRGLQVVFQRRMEETPLAHLRRLRLHAAREALQRPSSPNGTTVTAVARRFGYSNIGRFGAHYRSQFDESPSATLDRVRG